MSLFSTPKVKPDPAARAAALRQQTLADSQLTEALQGGIINDTRTSFRLFGAQPGSYSAPLGGGGGSGGYGGYGGNGRGWFK